MRIYALLVALLALPAAAQSPLSGVPLERVAEAQREPLRQVARDPTVETELTDEARCSPAVYRFLLTRLPFAARAIEALDLEGAGRYDIEDLGGGRFTIDDRAGARATCARALDEEGTLVVLAPGRLDVAVLPSIEGTGLIVLRYAPDADDPTVTRARCQVLFRLSNRALRVLASPVRDALAHVLRDKLTLLVRSATRLAELVERDPWRVYEAVLRDGAASPAELQAYREAFLLR